MTAVTATLYYPVISLRVVQAIPEVELERRRRQIKNSMSTQDIDMLILHSMDGSMRYLSNYLGLTKPEYMILPAEGEMMFVGRNEDSVAEARTHFGLSESQSLPANTLNSTGVDAEAIMRLVESLTPKTIGIVGVSNLTAAFHMRLQELLGSEKIVDATTLVDQIRMIKSNVEMVAIERSATICDKVVQSCLQTVKPGKREYEAIAEMLGEAHIAGGENIHLTTGSGPTSKEVHNLSMNLKNRILSKGDLFRLHASVSGPGGYWTEISRTVGIGSISADATKAFQQALEVRNAAVEELSQDKNVSQIYKAALAKVKELDSDLAIDAFGYSQGLDIREKPIIYTGEEEKVKSGMHFCIKCIVKVGKAYGQVCDNYLVTDEGARRLQKTPEEPLVTEA